MSEEYTVPLGDGDEESVSEAVYDSWMRIKNKYESLKRTNRSNEKYITQLQSLLLRLKDKLPVWHKVEDRLPEELDKYYLVKDFDDNEYTALFDSTGWTVDVWIQSEKRLGEVVEYPESELQFPIVEWCEIPQDCTELVKEIEEVLK